MIALHQTIGYISDKFSVALNHISDLFLKDVVVELRERYRDFDFSYRFDSSSMRPDGGILSIVSKDDEKYPIISIIREIVTSWDSVKKTFTDGGLLKGILRIGGVIISAILAPIQGLLEILSHIPGLDKLAGKGAEKIAELRNVLRGDEKVVANIKAPKVTPEVEKIEAEITPDFDFSNMPLPDMSTLNLPAFDGSPVSNTVTGTSGKSALHGVYDVSGAAPALGGGAARSSQSMAGAAEQAVDSAVRAILNVVRNIDANITRIAAWSFAPEGTLVPAPITQGERATYSLQERRDISIIELRAAQGTDAEVKQVSPETNIRLIRSGGNAYA
jgi:hypothetical protein